jgi:threonine dehydratase
MHRRWRYASEVEVCIGGGGSKGGTSEVEMQAAKAVKVAAVEMEVEAKVAKAAEAEGCVGGGGMHWKHWNASEVHRGRWS